MQGSSGPAVLLGCRLPGLTERNRGRERRDPSRKVLAKEGNIGKTTLTENTTLNLSRVALTSRQLQIMNNNFK